MTRTIEVQGLHIKLEKINQQDYISLTDIAKQSSERRPADVIKDWIRNTSTIRYLYAWETLHNKNIKVVHLHHLLDRATDRRLIMSPEKWIEETNAIGIVQRLGRGGGTYAHEQIALDFCYWISPEFKVYLHNEFIRLKREEAQKDGLEWHVKRITDSIDEARNWLDTIPGQDPKRNRLNYLKPFESETEKDVE